MNAELTSWCVTPTTQAIRDFVDRVTNTESAYYVPPEERDWCLVSMKNDWQVVFAFKGPGV